MPGFDGTGLKSSSSGKPSAEPTLANNSAPMHAAAAATERNVIPSTPSTRFAGSFAMN